MNNRSGAINSLIDEKSIYLAGSESPKNSPCQKIDSPMAIENLTLMIGQGMTRTSSTRKI
jgi:hypothetical protein